MSAPIEGAARGARGPHDEEGRTGASAPERLAVAFAFALRARGIAVAAGAPLRYAEALAAVGLEREGPVYWAGRATLLQDPDDIDGYDDVFHAFWRLGGSRVLRPFEVPRRIEVATDDGLEEDGVPAEEDSAGDARVLELRYSPTEILREKDFAECTPAELAEAQRLMSRIRLRGPRRPTRRRRPARRRGDWPDLRRTVRHALRAGGEPVRRSWLEEADRPRRIVFLCDVSGSMAPYSRALLRFVHVAVAARRSVEVFTIGTRLTRVTRALVAHDPDAALGRVAKLVPDWSGGTRLGEALREFNDLWGVRGLARGAIVVIFSDGWDRGDPAVLAREMARLSLVAHEVVWVNPLKATPGYAPLVRGMAAALPYVDQFMEGHSLASLESLAGVITGRGAPGAVADGRRGRIEVG